MTSYNSIKFGTLLITKEFKLLQNYIRDEVGSKIALNELGLIMVNELSVI